MFFSCNHFFLTFNRSPPPSKGAQRKEQHQGQATGEEGGVRTPSRVPGPRAGTPQRGQSRRGAALASLAVMLVGLVIALNMMTWMNPIMHTNTRVDMTMTMGMSNVAGGDQRGTGFMNEKGQRGLGVPGVWAIAQHRRAAIQHGPALWHGVGQPQQDAQVPPTPASSFQTPTGRDSSHGFNPCGGHAGSPGVLAGYGKEAWHRTGLGNGTVHGRMGQNYHGLQDVASPLPCFMFSIHVRCKHEPRVQSQWRTSRNSGRPVV